LAAVRLVRLVVMAASLPEIRVNCPDIDVKSQL
jgi:hypothetical protein